jgi:hypothetical protein
VARLAFVEHDEGSATLFANGDAIPLDPDLAYAARLVTGREQVPADALTPHVDDDAFVALLASLVNDGLLELNAT